MDSTKCWEQIDTIISVLDKGFRYLATQDVEDSALEKYVKDTVYADKLLEEDEKKLIEQMRQAKLEA